MGGTLFTGVPVVALVLVVSPAGPPSLPLPRGGCHEPPQKKLLGLDRLHRILLSGICLGQRSGLVPATFSAQSGVGSIQSQRLAPTGDERASPGSQWRRNVASTQNTILTDWPLRPLGLRSTTLLRFSRE